MKDLKKIDAECDMAEWARKLYLGTVEVTYDELSSCYTLTDRNMNQLVLDKDIYLYLCNYYERL